jgi:hypothetical protein
MSERGVFAVCRTIWHDPDLAPERFTQREALMWLVSEAAWKERKVRGARGAIILNRGEICHSVRFMAEAWHWSKSRVDRFLTTLKKRDIIRDTERAGTKVYSIKNYNKYQTIGLPPRDAEQDDERDASGTPAGHQRDKLEEGKHSNIKSIGDPAGEPKPLLRKRGEDPQFEEFWKLYPLKKAKDVARKAWPGALKRATFDAIMAGLSRYAAARAGQDPTYTAHASTWLNQGRWTDEEFVTPSPGVRRNGSGYYLTHGTKEYEAWKRHYRRENSAKIYDFPDKPGHEARVLTRWPSYHRGGQCNASEVPGLAEDLS